MLISYCITFDFGITESDLRVTDWADVMHVWIFVQKITGKRSVVIETRLIYELILA